MIEEKDLSAIGKFQKTHALKGELNAILDIDPDFLIEGNAAVVEIDGIYVPFFVDSLRTKGATSYLIKLDGVDTEEEARKFVNKAVYGLKSELAPFLDIEEDEIYDEDELSGYEIIDSESGKVIGKVSHIDSTTSNVLFIVVTPDEKTIYIPAAEEFVEGIDDDKKNIIMSLPEGLIDLN